METSKILKILSLIVIIATISSSLFAASLRCSQCGRTIRPGGKYLQEGKNIYCSNSCALKTRPKCKICGKRSLAGFTNDKGEFYCSKACLQKSFPCCVLCGKHANKGAYLQDDQKSFYCENCIKKPTCISCGKPGNCRRLYDGRDICSKCSKTAIKRFRDAEKIFKQVRTKMAKELLLKTDHKITLKLVSLKEMKKVHDNYTAGLELGLFSYEAVVIETTSTKKNILGMKLSEKVSRKKEESFTIYLLNYITPDRMIEVAAHELAHDWMQDKFPYIKELIIKEGWAEFVSSRINIIYKQEHLNRRMEKNPDPIYGKGYRLIRDIVRKKGSKGLMNYLKEKNRQGKLQEDNE